MLAVNLLIEKKCDVNKYSDFIEETPMFFALLYRKDAMVRTLLEAEGSLYLLSQSYASYLHALAAVQFFNGAHNINSMM